MAKPNYNAEIEWFIRCGSVALGERGTSAALLEMLKNGRPTGASGVPNSDLYSDQQLGWGRFTDGTIERANRCLAIWRKLPLKTREVLRARYDSRQWPPGVAGMLGDLAGVVVVLVGAGRARDRVRAATAKLEAEVALRGWSALAAELESSAQRSIITSDWQCVVDSCQSMSRDAKRRRSQWLADAGKALEEAHAYWEGVKSSEAEAWAQCAGCVFQ